MSRIGRPKTRTGLGAHLSPNDHAVAARLEKRRQDIDMTLREVVEACWLQMTIEQMRRCLSGEIKIPAGRLYAICWALDLSINEAFVDCRPSTLPRPAPSKRHAR